MSDIVERLTAPDACEYIDGYDLKQAAAEITRLRSELDAALAARLIAEGRVTTLEARVAQLTADDFDADAWEAKLRELHTWTASAFLAGEKVNDPERHKSMLYGFLCSLIGYLTSADQSARARSLTKGGE